MNDTKKALDGVEIVRENDRRVTPPNNMWANDRRNSGERRGEPLDVGRFAYVGLKLGCLCMVAATVDRDERDGDREHNMELIMEWLKDGRLVRRVATSVVRVELTKCPHHEGPF